MELPKVIYVMGPPGAGKGTQAELLAREIGYHRFSTGDAFRAISREDTDLGRQIKATIDNGYLGTPEMAAEVVISAVKQYVQQDRGLIFDGTPRTMSESQIVDSFFAREQYGRPMVIYLKVDKEEMEARSSKRRFCLDIKGDFPVISAEDEDRCQKLGGRVGVRPDDEPGKFATRWSQFIENTWPVIQKYQKEGIVHEVNGERPIAEVHGKVLEVIKNVTGNL